MLHTFFPRTLENYEILVFSYFAGSILNGPVSILLLFLCSLHVCFYTSFLEAYIISNIKFTFMFLNLPNWKFHPWFLTHIKALSIYNIILTHSGLKPRFVFSLTQIMAVAKTSPLLFSQKESGRRGFGICLMFLPVGTVCSHLSKAPTSSLASSSISAHDCRHPVHHLDICLPGSLHWKPLVLTHCHITAFPVTILRLSGSNTWDEKLAFWFCSEGSLTMFK